MTEYLTVKQLSTKFRVHAATVWRWTSTGRLPQPVRVAPGTTRWRSDEVAAVEARIAAERALTTTGKGEPGETD